MLSVLLRYTDSDYPFGIFKLFTRSGRFDPQNKNKKCLNPKSERSCMCVRDIEFASLSTIVLLHITTVLAWWYFLRFCFTFCYQLLGWIVTLRCYARFPIHICRDNNNGPLHNEITTSTLYIEGFHWFVHLRTKLKHVCVDVRSVSVRAKSCNLEI